MFFVPLHGIHNYDNGLINMNQVPVGKDYTWLAIHSVSMRSQGIMGDSLMLTGILRKESGGRYTIN
jgi:hypothetical protein